MTHLLTRIAVLPFLAASLAATAASAAAGDPLPASIVAQAPAFTEGFDDPAAFKARWKHGISRWPDSIQTRAQWPNKGKAVYLGNDFAKLGVEPYRVSRGVLLITAAPLSPQTRAKIAALVDRAAPEKLPAAGRATIKAATYSSGLIASTGRFAGGFGYYEARMIVPTGRGAWPIFWLYEWNRKLEIDVMEANASHVDGYHATLHTPYNATKSKEVRAGAPLPSQWHRYGVLVERK